MSFLLDAFPQSVLEIHVSEEYAAETTALVSPRIDVRTVLGREGAWLVRLVRVAAARPQPTIVLTGEGLRAWELMVRAAFLLCDPLVATRMNEFVMALRAVLDRT